MPNQEPELYPIGFALGPRAGHDGAPALHVRRGWDEIVLDDPDLATIWLLLGGQPQVDLSAPWGRSAVTRAYAELDAQARNADPARHLAGREQVDQWINRLVELGLALEVDPWAPEAVSATKTVRLCPLQMSLGNAGERLDLCRVGFPEGPAVRIGRRSFAYWKAADDVRSLAEMALFFSQNPQLDGQMPDVDWRQPRAQVPFIYFDIRPLLVYGLGYLDLPATPGPPLPDLAD